MVHWNYLYAGSYYHVQYHKKEKDEEMKLYSSILILETEDTKEEFLTCLSKEQLKRVLYYPQDMKESQKLIEAEDCLLVIPQLTNIKESDFELLEKFCEKNEIAILTYNFRRFKLRNESFMERFKAFISWIHETDEKGIGHITFFGAKRIR